MAKLIKEEYIDSKGQSHTNLIWWCPGCDKYHVVSPEKHSWNGSMDKPSFSPSLLCNPPDHNPPLCHSWMTDGVIKYLSDCEHSLANKEIEIPDIPDHVMELFVEK